MSKLTRIIEPLSSPTSPKSLDARGCREQTLRHSSPTSFGNADSDCLTDGSTTPRQLPCSRVTPEGQNIIAPKPISVTEHRAIQNLLRLHLNDFSWQLGNTRQNAFNAKMDESAVPSACPKIRPRVAAMSSPMPSNSAQPQLSASQAEPPLQALWTLCKAKNFAESIGRTVATLWIRAMFGRPNEPFDTAYREHQNFDDRSTRSSSV